MSTKNIVVFFELIPYENILDIWGESEASPDSVLITASTNASLFREIPTISKCHTLQFLLPAETVSPRLKY